MKSKDNSNVLYYDKNSTKKINKHKIVGVIILVIIIILIVITYIAYKANENVKIYIDDKILQKNIEENNLNKILLEDYDKSNIFAYQDKILILKSNILEQYNTSGKKESELNIEISTPLTSTENEYLMIAEEQSSKVYMIEDSKIKWEKNLEGNISKINVNSSGYSAVILSGTAYKSVIIVFDENGNELFKNYLSSTIAIDVAISPDCKYLSYAEVSTSGTLLQSNIKTISIDTAKVNSSEALIYTKKADAGKLILNITYQTNNNLVCMYDDEISVIKEKQDYTLATLQTDNEKSTYASINLSNATVRTVEESESLFSTKTTVKIINTTTQKEITYKFAGVTKEIYTFNNKIALNLGSEVHFIDTKGWLIKKYTSTQQIRNIVMSDKVAGIVYRNKIEIVKL